VDRRRPGGWNGGVSPPSAWQEAEHNDPTGEHNDVLAEPSVTLAEHSNVLMTHDVALLVHNIAVCELDITLVAQSIAVCEVNVMPAERIHATPGHPDPREGQSRMNQVPPVSVAWMPCGVAERFLCSIVRTVAVKFFARVG
jgi:hypothetical protein